MIDEHNIELRIFEYHEGLLDAGQKEELMAYLHEHPEWQRDFAVWAQSRLHASVAEVPTFQAQLLRKSPFFPLWLKYSFSLSAAFLCVLTWYWWPKEERASNPLIEKSMEQVSQLSIAQEQTVPFQMQDKNRKIVAPQKVKRESYPTTPQTTIVIEEPKPLATPSFSISSDTLVPIALPKDTVATPSVPLKSSEAVHIPSKKALAAADSLAKQEQQKALPKKEKNKIKHKFSLKPTSDIVPTNSNF